MPVFQFAVFYNGPMEFTWCAPMTVNGRTHANGDIYTGSAWPLTFNTTVTTSGTISAPAWDGHNTNEYTNSVTYSGNPGYVTNVPVLQLPIGTTDVHEIINMPPDGEDVNSALGQQRYYNKANLVLLVSNSTVTLTLKSSPSDLQATNITAYYFPTNASPTNYVQVTTNFRWLSITNTITDQRENDTVKLTDIDMKILKSWLVTNATAIAKFPNTAGVYGLSNAPNILYAADNRTCSANQLTAVRLKNGNIIPTNMVNSAGNNQPSGFTVATPNPLYVWGNYNIPDGTTGSTNTILHPGYPASLVSDALTILSQSVPGVSGWQDSQSATALGSSKNKAVSTTVNAAILTGVVPSTASDATSFSGGVHNLPRLLEDWGSGGAVTLTLNTSIVNMFPSTRATNQFRAPGQYYQAPTRQFSFDLNFLDYTKQPPGTPLLVCAASVPWITSQPQSRSVAVGQTATFWLWANGFLPLSYQWQFAGTDIPNATNSSFSIPSAGTSDAGNYSVIVTNAFGSAVSSNAVLTVTVIDSLFIAAQPQSQTVGVGSNVTFNVTVYGAPPYVFQWYFNGTPLGSPATGTNLLSCTLTNVGTNQAGNYSVQVVNGYGSVTSSNALLTVKVFPPSITVQPSNLLVLPGTNVAFGVSASGTAPFGYQWRFSGTNLLDATDALYSIPSVGTNNAGYYAVVVTNLAGSTTSSNTALSVVLSPSSQTNTAGLTATFTATAFSPEALNYQWQKNGTNLVEGGRLSGTTNSTLTIASVSDADAANYSAVVSDAYSSVTTSNASLTVIDPPSITAQPLAHRIMLGSSVSFSVAVTGTAPFSFQWRFNGINLLDATNAAYLIQAVGATNTGNYSVVVTNSAGRMTSSNALLTVIVPPTLALQLWAGYPLLDLNGMLSSNFVVQYNTNLAGTNWTDLLSLTNLPSSPYLFLDPAGDSEPGRFYRAFMQ